MKPSTLSTSELAGGSAPRIVTAVIDPEMRPDGASAPDDLLWPQTSLVRPFAPQRGHAALVPVDFLDASIAGSGPCKAQNCKCDGYKPNNPKNDYCRVCGHSWHMHKDALSVCAKIHRTENPV